MVLENMIETDVLVIGGGIAGCFAAIKAREQGLDVTIVDKGHAGKSGASIHPDIFWMVFNTEWGADFDECMKAFVEGGEYLNHREWCEIILKESWQIYQDMLSWGIEFPPDTLKYAKHFPPFTGTRIKHRHPAPALRRQAEKVGIRIMDRIMITDLIKEDGQIIGAVGFPIESFDLHIFKAKAVVLAGGSSSFKTAGEMAMLTGDAEAMAYRAGAEITGKEFGSSTFPSLARYPAWGRAAHGQVNPAFPNIVDGEGKVLELGMIHPNEDVRQEWTLELESVVHAGKGPIFWDFSNATKEEIGQIADWQAATHSPREIEIAKKAIDLDRPDKIQLSGGYAAGFANVGTGGIFTYNTKCETLLPGLYVAGDCGGTRHNGSYITNPGLGTCPSAVTGRHAGVGASGYANQNKKAKGINQANLERLKTALYAPVKRKAGFSPRWVTQILRDQMTPYFITYIKHERRLQAALTIVEFLRDHMVPKMYAKDSHELRLAHETKNMVLNAEMMLKASLFRTESRGMHYREDYHRRDDSNWLAWTKLREEGGDMKFSKEPVPNEWWPDVPASQKETNY